MNYIAPLPDSYNSMIIDAFDYGVEAIHSCIKEVSSVVTSAEFNIGTSSLDCMAKVGSIAYFAQAEIVNQISNTVLPISELTEPAAISGFCYDFVETLKKVASVWIELFTTFLSNISTVVSVHNVICLYDKTMENIKEREDAKASGDENRILRANFNAVALTSDYLKVPAAILAALVLCGVTIPAIVLTATAVIAAVGAYFAAAHVVVYYTQHVDTLNLLNELKLARHHVFLNEYYTALIEKSKDDEETAELTRLQNAVNGLTLEETTSAKKEIKHSIREADDKKAIYIKSLKDGNQRFINLLNEKIALDPKLVEQHFRLKETDASTYNNGIWEPAIFFEKLFSPEFQADEQKLQQAVKCLKIRLEDKLISDKSEMILGSFGVIATSLGVASAAGVAIAPLIATVGLILTVPKIALLVEEHYFRKPEFINAMKRLTATVPDLEVDSSEGNLSIQRVQYQDHTVDLIQMMRVEI